MNMLTQTPRFQRLTLTQTFRQGGLDNWMGAVIAIFGAGNLGQRFALEAVLSGARVIVYDFDHASSENQGTQRGAVGARKVDVIVEAANAIQVGRAIGFCCDARHASIGELAEASVLVDCTDDPALAAPLTRISNGLGVPLLRAALDGSGQMEMGRVLCSHGGVGRSCQLCTYDLKALLRHTTRMPCPGQVIETRDPTLAGGAIGMIVAGATLLQAQRLVTGNDLDQVINRELIIDMTNGQLLALQRQPSEQCLTSHKPWALTRLERRAEDTTLDDLFDEVERRFTSSEVTLEPYGHPLCIEAVCECGATAEAFGTQWAPPPDCPTCEQPMQWAHHTWRDRLRRSDAGGFADSTLTELGLPSSGAMFVARATGKPPIRFVLSTTALYWNGQVPLDSQGELE